MVAFSRCPRFSSTPAACDCRPGSTFEVSFITGAALYANTSSPFALSKTRLRFVRRDATDVMRPASPPTDPSIAALSVSAAAGTFSLCPSEGGCSCGWFADVFAMLRRLEGCRGGGHGAALSSCRLLIGSLCQGRPGSGAGPPGKVSFGKSVVEIDAVWSLEKSLNMEQGLVG